MESTPSPRSQLPSPPGSVPITLATSVAIPNPSLTESRHLFAPYAPLFNSVRSSLESPPTMIPHPMINPVEYVQQLREISAAQQQAQREQQQQQREPIHQATILERERGGSAGSADSVDTNGGSFEITPGMVYGPGKQSVESFVFSSKCVCYIDVHRLYVPPVLHREQQPHKIWKQSTFETFLLLFLKS